MMVLKVDDKEELLWKLFDDNCVYFFLIVVAS